MRELRVSFPISYTCQFASPALVRAFVHGERPLESDPAWASYGAATPEEYAHWARRACGVVCVKMAVEGIMGLAPRPVMDWVREGLALDGYLTEQRADRAVEKGWKHASLARLAVQHGCDASLAGGMTVESLAAHLREDRAVIASVTSELGEEGPLTRASGHLVVAFGAVLDEDGGVCEVVIHNPSGRTTALQAGARIPVERFTLGFSGRGIVVGAGKSGG